MTVTKPTNPKDQAAVAKLPIHFVPPILQVYAAIGFAEGAYKYGAYNWRPGGARASVYYSALLRHLSKWWNGEEFDANTNVPHLANAISCLGILIDSREQGCLVDDRPPVQVNFSKTVDALASTIAGLQEQFKDLKPHHHTALDSLGNISGQSTAGLNPSDRVSPTVATLHGKMLNTYHHATDSATYKFAIKSTTTKDVHLIFFKNNQVFADAHLTLEEWSTWLRTSKFPTNLNAILDEAYACHN